MTAMTRPDLTDWRVRLAEKGIVPAQDVPEGETPEDVAARRRVQAENRAARWRKRLPVLYAEASLNDLDEAQHADAVRGWLDGDSPTLLLAGTVGAGKTHAAYAVGHEGVSRGLHVEAVTTHDLLEALRPGGDEDIRSGVRSAELLLLDDLGASKATDFAQDEITSLMDHRLNNGLRQIVTTNATSDLLRENWGPRLLDRLLFKATVLVYRGESRRAAW